MQTVGVKVTVATVGVTQDATVPVPFALTVPRYPQQRLIGCHNLGLDGKSHLGDVQGGEVNVSTSHRLVVEDDLVRDARSNSWDRSDWRAAVLDYFTG